MVRKAAAVEACDISNTASEFDSTAARKSCSFSGLTGFPGLNIDVTVSAAHAPWRVRAYLTARAA